jgi:Rrf2 family protein
MAILALRFGYGPVLLREVAEREQISEKYLSQIVIPLRSAALIRSIRGARGGYTLAREPRDIDLREIVDALEGGLDIADVENPQENGSTSSAIVAREIWRELSREIARSLSRITLEDIVHRVHDRGQGPVMYNI